MPKETFLNLPVEKKKRIVEAGKKAFSKVHYNKVTIDSIVALAEIPKGSFYQYFDNKDDLFKYIFEDIGNEKSDILIKDVQNYASLNFSELIIQMIESARKFESQDEAMINLKNRFLKECPQEVKDEILNKSRPESMVLFEKVITLYIDKGEFRKDIDVKMVSFIITSIIFELEYYPINEESDHGEVLKKALDVFVLGLKH